jgi:hypothetical protein
MPVSDLSGLGFPGGIAMGEELNQQKELNTLAMQQATENIKLTDEEIKAAPMRRRMLSAQSSEAEERAKALTIANKRDEAFAKGLAEHAGIIWQDEEGKPRSLTDVYTELGRIAQGAGNPEKAAEYLGKASEASERAARADQARGAAAKIAADHSREIVSQIEAFWDNVHDRASFDAMVGKLRAAGDTEAAAFAEKLVPQLNTNDMTGGTDWDKVKSRIHNLALTATQRINEQNNKRRQDALDKVREQRMNLMKARENRLEKEFAEREKRLRRLQKDGAAIKVTGEQRQMALDLVNSQYGPTTEHKWSPEQIRVAADGIAAEAVDMGSEPGAKRDFSQLLNIALDLGRQRGSFGEKSYEGGGRYPETAIPHPTWEVDPKTGKPKGTPPKLRPGIYYQIPSDDPKKGPEIRQYTGEGGLDAWDPPLNKPGLTNNSADWLKRDRAPYDAAEEELRGQTQSDIEEDIRMGNVRDVEEEPP